MAFVNLLDIIYPVGSVYFSTSAISPAESIGGTWTQVENKYLYAGENIEQGGVASHTHEPHLQAQVTSHGSTIYYGYGESSSVGISNWVSDWSVTGGGDNGPASTTEPQGAIVYGYLSEEDNNPPYQSFYCWYRTA